MFVRTSNLIENYGVGKNFLPLAFAPLVQATREIASEDESFFDVTHAALAKQNIALNAYWELDLNASLANVDPEYNALNDPSVPTHFLENESTRNVLMKSTNADATAKMLSAFNRQEEADRVLENSGLIKSVLGYGIATAMDPVAWGIATISGGAGLAARAGMGIAGIGSRLATSVGMGVATGVAFESLSEASLQSLQATRTLEESFTNITGAALIGAAIPGVSALVKRAGRSKAYLKNVTETMDTQRQAYNSYSNIETDVARVSELPDGFNKSIMSDAAMAPVVLGTETENWLQAMTRAATRNQVTKAFVPVGGFLSKSASNTVRLINSALSSNVVKNFAGGEMVATHNVEDVVKYIKKSSWLEFETALEQNFNKLSATDPNITQTDFRNQVLRNLQTRDLNAAGPVADAANDILGLMKKANDNALAAGVPIGDVVPKEMDMHIKMTAPEIYVPMQNMKSRLRELQGELVKLQRQGTKLKNNFCESQNKFISNFKSFSSDVYNNIDDMSRAIESLDVVSAEKKRLTRMYKKALKDEDKFKKFTRDDKALGLEREMFTTNKELNDLISRSSNFESYQTMMEQFRYFTQSWNKSKMLTPEGKDKFLELRVGDIIAESEAEITAGVRKRKMNKDVARKRALEEYHNITVARSYVGESTAISAERSIIINDKQKYYDAGLFDDNLDHVFENYISNTAKKTAYYSTFEGGDAGFTQLMGKVRDEYQELFASATSEAELRRLERGLKSDEEYLNTLKQRVMGQEKNNASSVMRSLNNLAYTAQLGGVVLYAPIEFLRLSLADGFGKLMGESFKLFTNSAYRDLSKASAAKLGLGLNHLMKTNRFKEHMPFGYTSGNVFEQATSALISPFEKVSLINKTQDFLEVLSNNLIHDRLARDLPNFGSLSPELKSFYANFGITEKSAARISKARAATDSVYVDSGFKGELTLPNIDAWEDSILAMEYAANVNQMSSFYIIRPSSGDLPAAFNNQIFKFMSQYTSWVYGATNKMLLSAVYKNDANMASNMVLQSGVGILVGDLKDLLAGRNPMDKKFDERVINGIDNAGVLGIMQHGLDFGNYVLNTTSDDTLKKRIKKDMNAFKVTNKLFGTGTVMNTFNLVNFPVKLATGAATKKDAKRFMQAIPANNIFYTKPFVDAAKDKIVNSLGLPE